MRSILLILIACGFAACAGSPADKEFRSKVSSATLSVSDDRQDDEITAGLQFQFRDPSIKNANPHGLLHRGVRRGCWKRVTYGTLPLVP
jgi:hypothetical protein